MKILQIYFATIIPLGILDGLWLVFIAKNFYAKHLGFLFSKTFNFAPIAVFYPLYAFAVMFLVVMPALEEQSLISALWKGALFGLAAYAAYDLTNHATIANWPLIITIVDIAWGAVVTALASAAAYLIISALK